MSALDALNALSEEYGLWLAERGYPEMCAMELQAEYGLWIEADEASEWIRDFIARWDAAQKLADLEYRNGEAFAADYPDEITDVCDKCGREYGDLTATERAGFAVACPSDDCPGRDQ